MGRRYLNHLVAISAVLAATCACAKRVSAPANLTPGTPHISWIIMYGDADNPDQEFACQSDPRSECIVPSSRPDAQVFSAVHIYSHGAGAETKYEGSFRVSFLEGATTSNQFRISNIVKKNEEIYNQSVRGLVTATPGTYHIAFDVTATVSENARLQPLRQQIPVVIK